MDREAQSAMNILTLNPTADEHTKTVSWYVAGPFFLIPMHPLTAIYCFGEDISLYRSAI